MITLWLPSFAFWGLSIPPYGSVPPESLGRVRALLPAVCTFGDVTSSYGSPSTGLKLFWFYNLQLLIPASWVLCWPENRVTWMLEESLGGSWCNLHTPPCPWCTGNDSALQWRFFCECVVAQLQTWSGLAFRVLVPSSLQTPGCSSEEPLFLCCVSFYFHHCLGHF